MMTAPEAFLEIEARKINLAYTFDAMWLASVVLEGAKKSYSALALTSIGAVESLCAKLEAQKPANDPNITPERWVSPF